jgi:hypothetical protein
MGVLGIQTTSIAQVSSTSPHPAPEHSPFARNDSSQGTHTTYPQPSPLRKHILQRLATTTSAFIAITHPPNLR